MIALAKAETDADLEVAIDLVNEYERSLVGLTCSASLEKSGAALRERYSGSAGVLFVARSDGTPAGCIAMRPVEGQTCEMYRLYVRPQFRGHGIGRRLVAHLIDDARAKGFNSMRLHTLKALEAAVRLYTRAGFAETDPFETSIDDQQVFMRLDLDHRPEGFTESL